MLNDISCLDLQINVCVISIIKVKNGLVMISVKLYNFQIAKFQKLFFANKILNLFTLQTFQEVVKCLSKIHC